MICLITKDNSGIRTRFCGKLLHGISFVCNYDAEYYKKHRGFFENFNSGNDILDDILRKELHRHKECTTFLFYQENDDIPIAFCSMCCSSVHVEEEWRGAVEKIMHPAIEFRYFAVRKDKQNKAIAPELSKEKISAYIFSECMRYAYIISGDAIAAEYFILHALDTAVVRSFYRRHGFIELCGGMETATDITLTQNCIPAYLKIKESFKSNNEDN